MPVAFSGFTPIHFAYSPTSRADIISMYSALLPSAGWNPTSVSGGVRFRATSPQGFQIDLFVVDLGHHLGPSFGPTTTLYFQTTDTSITGFQHELVADGRPRNLIVGPSQIFDSLVGVAVENQGGTFCGGIPFFPNPAVCHHEIPAMATTRGFWAMSDFNTGVTCRTSLILGTNFSAPDSRNNCEALWNSAYCAPGNPIGSVRIPTLTPGPQIFQSFNVNSPTLWYNDDFLRIEPMLVWGINNATLPRIQAEMYDAVIFSKQMSMDVTTHADGYDWLSFTDNYLYGSLNLLLPLPAGGGTGSYSYTNS